MSHCAPPSRRSPLESRQSPSSARLEHCNSVEMKPPGASLATPQLDAKVAGATLSSSSIQRAAALSAACTALGPTLRPFSHSRQRWATGSARNFTRRCDASQAWREVETLAAERIVEEELATWQTQEAEIQRATGDFPPVVAPRKVPFESPEPASEVRFNRHHDRPSISYRLEPKCGA